MSRRQFLITYDVSDDKRRDSIFETLKDHGEHVQYSVFICELSAADLARLRSLLVAEIHRDQDQILIVDLGPSSRDLMTMIECLGQPFQRPPRAFIV